VAGGDYQVEPRQPALALPPVVVQLRVMAPVDPFLVIENVFPDLDLAIAVYPLAEAFATDTCPTPGVPPSTNGRPVVPSVAIVLHWL
jgi:hypothetical protein